MEAPADDLGGWRRVLGLPATPSSGLATTTAEPIDDTAMPVTMRGLSLAARVLRSSHCLLGSSGGEEDGDRALTPTWTLLGTLLPWLQQIIPIIYQLAPSQARTLDANRLVKSLYLARPADSRRASSLSPATSQGSSSDDLDAVPLAYDTRRDSRTRQSDRQPHLHANQQRMRDQLHAWIRSMSRWRPTQAACAGFELINGVHDENLTWFAELLLSEYEQLERHQLHRTSRLERLEVRLTNGARGSTSSEDNPVLVLVRMTDSLRLTVALQSLLFTLIEDTLLGPLLEDCQREGRERSESATASKTTAMSLLVERLISLGRLLAACAQKSTGQYDDPVLCFARDLLMERVSEEQVLVVILSLVGSLLRAGPPSLALGLDPLLRAIRLAQGRGKEKGGERRITDIVLRLLLDALLGTDNGEGRVAELPSVASDTRNGSFSSELVLDPGSVELVLGCVVEGFRQWQGELAACCTLLGAESLSSSSSLSPFLSASSPPSTALAPPRLPRKVRPVTAAPEAAQVQRRLRQWFWWQWPAFREVGLALIRYLQGEGHAQTAAAHLLWTLLPPLLPEALREAPDPMLTLLIALLLEEYTPRGGEEPEGEETGEREEERAS